MRKISGLILSVLALTGLAKADNSFSEIDLTNFQDIPSIIDACDVPIENVGYSNSRNCRRFYITGLWGVSAATLNTFDRPGHGNFSETNTENIFTAGIAGGVSFERQRGRLRVEAEWLQRDFWATPYESDPSPTSRDTITDNWSVMANLWRDFMFTEKFGCYGGGGIGGGGMAVGFQELGQDTTIIRQGTAFSWQAGGGLIYEVTDQVTFDVSYRFYRLNDLTTTQPRSFDYGYSASQVMFSLRMFEPFRSLLR